MNVESTIDSDSEFKVWRRLDSSELFYAPGFPNMEAKNMKCPGESQKDPRGNATNIISSCTPEKVLFSIDKQKLKKNEPVPQFGPKKFQTPMLDHKIRHPWDESSVSAQISRKRNRFRNENESCDEMMQTDLKEVEGQTLGTSIASESEMELCLRDSADIQKLNNDEPIPQFGSTKFQTPMLDFKLRPSRNESSVSAQISRKRNRFRNESCDEMMQTDSKELVEQTPGTSIASESNMELCLRDFVDKQKLNKDEPIPQFGPKKFQTSLFDFKSEPPDTKEFSERTQSSNYFRKEVETCYSVEMMQTDSKEDVEELHVSTKQLENIIHDVIMVSPSVASVTDNSAKESVTTTKRGLKRKTLLQYSPRKKVKRMPGDVRDHGSERSQQRNRKSQTYHPDENPLILSRPVRNAQMKTRFSN